MKAKRIISLLLTFILTLSFGAVSVLAAPKLNATSFTLTKGYSTTLKVTGNSGSVSWSSSDASVATVNASGKVVGKGVGSATISAKVDGTTLRASVSVVATKITANKSAVTLEKGQSTTVTLTVTGTKTGLTLTSASSAIAKASWSGAKWDGNKITFKITANGPGTTNITVYRKNYRSSYYKTIQVTVPGAATPPASTADTKIYLSKTTLSVAAGASDTFQTYNDVPGNLLAASSDTTVANVTAGTTNGKYRTYNVTGVKSGTATIRVYDRTTNTSYADVTVTVTGSNYFQITTTRPTPSSTENVINIQKNGINYYMLVPYNYDKAVAATAIAKYFGKYDYYTVYSESPARTATGDTIQYISVTGLPDYTTTSPIPASGGVMTRYILLPINYDSIKYNTAVAEYTGEFEYYSIYNSRPNTIVRTDSIQTWQIVDNTGETVTRFVLLPSGYDANRLAALKSADLSANETFTYYKVLETAPINAPNNADVVSWRNSRLNAYRYMIVPRLNCDFVKRNDAIYNDTGIYWYYNAYSTSPTVKDASKEKVQSYWVQSGEKTVQIYILIDMTDKDAQTKLNTALNGTLYTREQGNYANTGTPT
jgi:hypothetical protein